MADRILRTDFGDVYERDGLVYLRNSSGGLVRFDSPNKALEQLRRGELTPATPEEVEHRDVERRVEAQGLAGRAQTVAESAIAGGFDTLAAPLVAPARVVQAITGKPNALAGVSGRKLLSAGAEVLGNPDYAQQQRERAEVHKGEATVGTIGGAVLTGGPLGRVTEGITEPIAGEIVRRAASGAIEGGLYGVQQTGDEAYLEDKPLTAEQVAAGGLLGMLFGAGFGAAHGTERVLRTKAKQRFLDIFAEESEHIHAREIANEYGRGETISEGKPAAVAGEIAGKAGRAAETEGRAVAPYRAPASDYQDIAAHALGPEVQAAPTLGAKVREVLDKVNEGASAAQSAATGSERDVLARHSPLNWRNWTGEQKGWDLYQRRDEILDGAQRDLAADAKALVDSTRTVTREIWEPPAKVEQVRANLSGLTTAERETASVALRKQSDLLKRDIGGLIETAPTPELRRQSVEYLKSFQTWFERIDDAAAKGEVADGYGALDQAKRELQSKIDTAGKTLGRIQDPLQYEAQAKLLQQMEQIQERTRQFLMDPVWGKQGEAQRAANAAATDYIAVRRNFERRFTADMGREYGGFGGFPIREVDPDKIANYVGKLGRAAGVLDDRVFRGYVNASRKLVEAMGDGYSALSPEARQAIDAVRQSADRLHATLGKADETIRVANQIDEVVSKDHDSSLLGGAAIGGIAGGPIGALIGAGISMATRPGRMIQQAAAIRSILKSVDGRVADGVKRFFGRFDVKVPAEALPMPGASEGGRLGRAARRTVLAGAPRIGLGKPGEERRRVYKERAEQVIALTDPSGAALHTALVDNIGGLTQTLPNLHTRLVVQTGRALTYLRAQLPAAVTDPELVRLGFVQPSDADLDRFAAAWEGTVDPLSFVDDLADRGFVDPVKRDAVRAVWPEFWADLQAKAMTQLLQLPKPPPYDARVQLDAFLEAHGAIEPSLRPDFLTRQSALMQRQKQETPPPRGGKPVNVARGFATTTQQLEM